MGEWNAKTMIEATDEDILNEMRQNEPHHHQGAALAKAVDLRNTNRLAEAIREASKSADRLGNIGISLSIAAVVLAAAMLWLSYLQLVTPVKAIIGLSPTP